MKKVIFGSALLIGGILGIIGSSISNAILRAAGIGINEETTFVFLAFIALSLIGISIGANGIVSKNKD